MSKMRKKTLQELMQERATGIRNQSVYTTEPRRITETSNESVKSQVDKLFQRKNRIVTNSTVDKVNKKFLEITSKVNTTNKLLNTTANIELNENNKNKLAEMDSKNRFEYLSKYVRPDEKDFQDIQLYSKTKQGEKLAKEINEAEGAKKILPTAKYFAKELAENTTASFADIQASLENLAGKDRNNEEIKLIQKYKEAINSTQQNLDSELIRTVGQGFAGIGNMAPSILVGSAVPRYR